MNLNKNKKNFIQASGELFTAVQSSSVLKDSKTFVDSIPRNEPKLILELYRKEKSKTNFNLKTFVQSHFDVPSELSEKINLPENRTMREHIKLLWQILKREALSNVNKNSTLIPIPKPYIIPGGRFREIYYWDSYFTMHGLLADGEIEIVENMIDNFAYLIDEFGFIPNGNRVYYLTRSQPPFFAPIIDSMCKYKKADKWGLKYLPHLEKEYRFWCGDKTKNITSNHAIEVLSGKFLNRYFDPEELPREESYLEDVTTLQGFPIEDKGRMYQNIRSAAESGWDFSSRWFKDLTSLTSCIASEILPVDLNCLLLFSESFISRLYELNNNKDKRNFYSQLAKERVELIKKYFWDEEKKFYFDYNWKTKERTNVYSLAACYPLYFNIAEKEMASHVKEKIESDFLKAGGVITTTNLTGQQWDAPNGWAPLQWITIKGLRNYKFNELADEIKNGWLTLNQKVFERTGKMFEKYNVDDVSLHAGGLLL